MFYHVRQALDITGTPSTVDYAVLKSFGLVTRMSERTCRLTINSGRIANRSQNAIWSWDRKICSPAIEGGWRDEHHNHPAPWRWGGRGALRTRTRRGTRGRRQDRRTLSSPKTRSVNISKTSSSSASARCSCRASHIPTDPAVFDQVRQQSNARREVAYAATSPCCADSNVIWLWWAARIRRTKPR